jgi:hypothetical protein
MPQDFPIRPAPPAETPPRLTAAAVITALRDDAADWARDKHWQWRVPLLVWLGWTGFRYLADPEYASLFSGIIFGSHEFGHLAFAFFGELLTVAGGSLMQLLVPVGAGALLVSRRDYFGLAVAGCWLSFSLANLAVYIGDATAQQLPLLGFGPDPEHDWHYLLGRVGLLGADHALAAFTRSCATGVLLLSLALGAWLCLRMARPSAAGAPIR